MATQQEIANYDRIIVTTAMKQGVPQVNAKIIAAQSAYETANFSSNNFLSNHNGFGMAVPKVRKSPYILGAGNVNAPAGEGGFAYARYASLQDSVKDLVDWLRYNHVDWNSVNTPESYDAFLVSKGYHTGAQNLYTAGLIMYYDKIKDIIYKNPKTALAIVGGLAVIAGGVIIYYNRKKSA